MENPRASFLLIDPRDYGEYRVTLRYERTDRHGPAFEALRRDVDTVAALQGMQDVFRLRAADVYRVLRVERVRARGRRRASTRSTRRHRHRRVRPRSPSSACGSDARPTSTRSSPPRSAVSTSCSGSGTRS